MEIAEFLKNNRHLTDTQVMEVLSDALVRACGGLDKAKTATAGCTPSGRVFRDGRVVTLHDFYVGQVLSGLAAATVGDGDNLFQRIRRWLVGGSPRRFSSLDYEAMVRVARAVADVATEAEA